jgi:hypothetical protein
MANFQFFAESRPAVIIASHERSGTHFLMNALAACYGYVSAPWVNFDTFSVGVNFYYPRAVSDVLLKLAEHPMANIVKSHHPADFFIQVLPALAERYVFFTIVRDPVSVMLSFWRFLHGLPWAEGPKVADPVTLARSEPCGQMMRYQMRQYPTLLARWAAHVDSWLNAAQSCPRVAVVRYEDLDQHYAETMHGFAPLLGRPPQALSRPARDVNVIPGGPEDPTGAGIPPDLEKLRRLCRESVGDTMTRLGY